MLRAESRHRLPGEQRRLHGLAARWHAAHGNALDGVRHAVEAADWELAGDLIGEQWMVFLTRGAAPDLLELARRIPDEVIRADAELALGVAGLLFEAATTPPRTTCWSTPTRSPRGCRSGARAGSP